MAPPQLFRLCCSPLARVIGSKHTASSNHDNSQPSSMASHCLVQLLVFPAVWLAANNGPTGFHAKNLTLDIRAARVCIESGPKMSKAITYLTHYGSCHERPFILPIESGISLSKMSAVTNASTYDSHLCPLRLTSASTTHICVRHVRAGVCTSPTTPERKTKRRSLHQPFSSR